MENTIEFIESKGKFGMKLGLERIGLLLEKLGNPQKKLKYIHIAGSNGKGSVSRILESVLTQNGLNTGMYTSPHLEKFNERIRVNKEDISDSDLDRIFKKVEAACQEMEKDGFEHPTGFEIETAIAFLYFLERDVDLVILETGLGGRLDATNIIDNNIVSGITSISLEHTQWLGDTLEEIALEKAAIIKKDSNVVIAPQKEGVATVIEKDAKDREAKKIVKLEGDQIELTGTDLSGQDFEWEGKTYRLPLLGTYQKENFLTALNVLKILKEEGYPVRDIQEGLNNLTFPGRFEVLSTKPTIIIDGAHNADGISMLMKTFKSRLNFKPILFFGILKDKNVDQVLDLLLPAVEKLYLLTPDSPDALNAHDLYKLIQEKGFNGEVKVLNSIDEIQENIDFDTPDKEYVLTGSLYLVGPARTELKKAIKKP